MQRDTAHNVRYGDVAVRVDEHLDKWQRAVSGSVVQRRPADGVSEVGVTAEFDDKLETVEAPTVQRRQGE